MPDTGKLILTLKQLLRQQKITYAKLGFAIGLSESSIKRLFTKGDMSLSRLQTICDHLNLDLGELTIMARERQRTVHHLSHAQETQLVKDEKLLLMAYLLSAGWTADEMMRAYALNEVEAIRILVRLDKMKLIDLLPNNRVRLRLAHDFQWRENGPINRYFNQQVQREFFSTNFESDNAKRLVNNGYMSQASIQICQQKMDKLKLDIDNLIKADQKLDKKHLLPITHITALRPWVFSAFEKYARANKHS